VHQLHLQLVAAVDHPAAGTQGELVDDHALVRVLVNNAPDSVEVRLGVLVEREGGEDVMAEEADALGERAGANEGRVHAVVVERTRRRVGEVRREQVGEREQAQAVSGRVLELRVGGPRVQRVVQCLERILDEGAVVGREAVGERCR